MTDEAKTTATETSTADTKRQLETDLSEELNRLSKSFVDVVQVAWESDQRRQLERDLRTGLNSLADTLEQRFKQVSDSEQAKELVGKAEDVAGAVSDKVKKNEIAQELGEGLLKGLRLLANQLDNLATDLQSKSSKPNDQKDAATEIPIEQGK